MPSGNPAKKALEGRMADLRAAVESGRTFLLRPYPHTQVTVKSTNADEAEAVARALQPTTPSPDEWDDGMLVQLMILFAWVRQHRPDKADEWLTGALSDVQAS